MIELCQPSLGIEEVQALENLFKTNLLGRGVKVSEFEFKYAKHVGVSSELILSANCCSEGLFSSMKVLDFKSSDEIIVPTISFIAAGNAVCDYGSKLVLCDVDPRTMNVRAEDIEKVISPNSKAIIVHHFGGIPCEMDEIMSLSKKYNLNVIEDCASGVYSTYKGKALGTFGDIGMWSFDSMKILVCGDGAILYFKTPELRKKADELLYYGIGTDNKAQKLWNFDISCFGHRAIMNDMTAVVALEQLKKLKSFWKKRKYIHEYYNQHLKQFKWIHLPKQLPEYCQSSYYYYHVQLKNNLRDEYAKYLKEHIISTSYGYYPLHRIPKYENKGSFPNADYAADHTICLPMHQGLCKSQLDYIIEKTIEFDIKFC